jgi:transposase-like protein
MECKTCKTKKHQVKNGKNPSGSQKYLCQKCSRTYTPEPKKQGYSKDMRLLAVRMYVEGNSYNAIGRILKVNPQSVVNWVKAYTNQLPAAPMPKQPKIAELDELYTYLGDKKRNSMSSQS